jgi:7-carboxy-7-deazaguanine synthase
MAVSRNGLASVCNTLPPMKSGDSKGRLWMPEGRKLPVIECFGPTIQGEGLMAGQKTHFLRLGGCGYRCSWCDTLYAVLPEQVKANRTMMTPEEIVRQLGALPPAKWVTLTGGDPAMHDLSELASALTEGGFKICIETQGQFWKTWMSRLNVVTVSPKPPSSGMADKTDFSVLNRYGFAQELCVKIVVFDDDDYEWGNLVFRRFMATGMKNVSYYMTPGTSQGSNEQIQHRVELRLKWLFEKAARDPDFDDRIKIIPQLHVLAWGDRKGV